MTAPLTEERAHKILVVTTMVSLEKWPDDLLASLNLAVAWDDRPVPPANRAFKRAVDEGLLKEDGRSSNRESLVSALARTIGGRMDAGTWGKETSNA